jgi:hypothetical protein
MLTSNLKDEISLDQSIPTINCGIHIVVVAIKTELFIFMNIDKRSNAYMNLPNVVLEYTARLLRLKSLECMNFINNFGLL